jgi:hypothetical protein
MSHSPSIVQPVVNELGAVSFPLRGRGDANTDLSSPTFVSQPDITNDAAQYVEPDAEA